MLIKCWTTRRWRRKSAWVIATAGYIKRSRDGVRISRESDGDRKQPKNVRLQAKEREARIGRSLRVGRQGDEIEDIKATNHESWVPARTVGLRSKRLKRSPLPGPIFFLVRNV